MKKILLSAFLFVALNAANSQVIINPQLPPFGLVLQSQLWNLALINAGNQSLSVQIQLVLTNAANNQKIFSGTSKVITLQKGLNELSINDVSPVTYTAVAVGGSANPNADGFLPLGVFSACYSITTSSPEGGGQAVSEQCEDVEVQPLSPPILITPQDSESIEITRPVFNWLPPEPYNLFSGLTYQYTLVAIQPTQSASDAVQQNVPVETEQNLSGTDLQYPLALPELDTGVLYAWQITATNNGTPLSKSEVYTFRIKKLNQDTTTTVVRKYFARLKIVNDESYTVMDGALRFVYLNEINDTSVQFILHDLTSATAVKTPVKLDSSYLQVVYGINYKTLEFATSNFLATNHMYLLELINSRKEHWYLRFQYVQLK